MYLSDEANVSDDLRRIINNGFHVYHPFKLKSAQLEDFIKSIHEIRELPLKDFHLCLEAVEKIAAKIRFCYRCYSKALVYFKLLTWKIDNEKFVQYRFAHSRYDWDNEAETDMLAKLKEYGV
ncbi:MAG: hypothetical protein PHR06_13765, partial [Candidatus Cloacimonetes bacterium]|nr:hypothetical protein [Candidatus Cloacimonadota bacterium]